MIKNILLSVFVTFTCAGISIAQGVCNPAANILIYSNYDGGTLNINIDENIPNIQIGLCSYETLTVNISGTYAGNVTKVLYAGYNDGGTTNVTGVAAAIVDILTYPPVYLADPDGNPYMVCAYDCDTAYVPGGCNTVDQATDYFLTELSGGLRYSYYQYGIWAGTYDMSDGGNCCYSAECFVDIDAGADVSICEGESATLAVSGAENYDWFDGIAAVGCSEPCASVTVTPTATTTYIVNGTDADACNGIDTITVFVYPFPEATIEFIGGDLVASGGGTYQWYFEGEIIDGATGATYTPEENGNYTVLVTSEGGCSDMSGEFGVVLNSIEQTNLLNAIHIYPNPVNELLNIQIENQPDLIINLFTINGDLIQINVLQLASDNFSINTSDLSSGVYMLEVISGSVSAMKKIVISH